MNLRKALFIYSITLLVLLYLLLYWVSNLPRNISYPYKKYRQDGLVNFVYPLETLNPKSAFYGMHYKNTYGLLRNAFENSTNELKYWKSCNWKKYFSTLTSSLDQLKKQNLDQDETTFTAAVILTCFKSYKVGDVFMTSFQAVDKAGRLKKYGGDYFRVRIFKQTSSNSGPDGIACTITDHKNGTYSLKAPLLHPGKWSIDLKLVLPVEGLAKIVEKTSLMKAWGPTYIATYRSGQTSVCNTDLSIYEKFKDAPTCDYSNPRNDQPWFCLTPKNGSCSPITNLLYGGTSEDKGVDFLKICSTFGCHINMTKNKFITVLPSKPMKNFPTAMSPCTTHFLKSSDSEWPSGYFRKNQWISLQCTSSLSNLDSLKACLQDKVIYFFGDSTIRQFFYLAASKLSLKVDGPDNSVIWQQPKIAYSSFPWSWYYNITLYYRAHGPPLQNPGPPSSRPYISDSIDGIEVGGKSVFIVLNVGVHLIHYEPSLYIHRLEGIKESIIKHLEIHPNTKFIIRGLNVVDVPFEWLIRRYEIILREIFKNIKNVLFLNFWDLTTVRPLDNYHPVDNTLNHEALLMFQYICE